MAKTVVTLNSAGIKSLLYSTGVAAECARQAQRIATKAGTGFGVSARWSAGFGGGRVAYGVKTVTQEAREAEANDKVLSKAVSSCRL